MALPRELPFSRWDGASASGDVDPWPRLGVAAGRSPNAKEMTSFGWGGDSRMVVT
jgi:hypothetical protein